MSTALGFMGLGLPPVQGELGRMISEGREYIVNVPLVATVPGLVLSLIGGTWLVVATLFARSGQEYRPVGWAHTIS